MCRMEAVFVSIEGVGCSGFAFGFESFAATVKDQNAASATTVMVRQCISKSPSHLHWGTTRARRCIISCAFLQPPAEPHSASGLADLPNSLLCGPILCALPTIPGPSDVSEVSN